jgi:hypothetical protein
MLSLPEHVLPGDVVVGVGRWAESSTRYIIALIQYLLPGRSLRFLSHPIRPADVVFGNIWTPAHFLAQHRAAVRVLVSGEHTLPPHITSEDYDVVIAPRADIHDALKSSTHILLPYFFAHFAERSRFRPTDLLLPASFNATHIRTNKTKFCAFLYWSDVDYRNAFYDQLHAHRPVDALGRARGGHGGGDRFSAEAFDNAVDVGFLASLSLNMI